MAETRLTQLPTEAATTNVGAVRETQAVVEAAVLRPNVGPIRETQAVVEAAVGGGEIRDTQYLIEVLWNPGEGIEGNVDTEALALDCTIAGLINQAMLETGIDVRSVTTRGNLGRHIVRHRAMLLGRLAARWEGVEIGDIVYPLTSPISLVDIGEIIAVEARRAVDQEWFPVRVIPLNDPFS